MLVLITTSQSCADKLETFYDNNNRKIYTNGVIIKGVRIEKRNDDGSLSAHINLSKTTKVNQIFRPLRIFILSLRH